MSPTFVTAPCDDRPHDTGEWPQQAVIEVDPLHVVVIETYADSKVDLVHAELGDAVRVTSGEGSGAVVEMAADGVLMIATGDVVLVALGVDRERDQTSSAATSPSVGSVELIGRAQAAVARRQAPCTG